MDAADKFAAHGDQVISELRRNHGLINGIQLVVRGELAHEVETVVFAVDADHDEPVMITFMNGDERMD